MTPPLAASLQSRLTRALPVPHGGAIISTVGKEGSGKTGWALSAAAIAKGSCVYIPMDRKPKGDYINNLIEQHHIYVPKTNFKVILTPNNQTVAIKLWDELAGLTKDSIQDPAIRTVIWDTGVYAWGLIRMARFGKLSQIMPHQYAPVNGEFQAVLWSAEEKNKIIIVIHSQSKEYKEGKDGKDHWTGNYERAGYSHMGFVANVSLEHFKTENEVPPQFGVRVLQNKLKPETDGREMIGEESSFAMWAWETWGGELSTWMGLD